jgi:hypothetical protein
MKQHENLAQIVKVLGGHTTEDGDGDHRMNNVQLIAFAKMVVATAVDSIVETAVQLEATPSNERPTPVEFLVRMSALLGKNANAAFMAAIGGPSDE